MVPLRVGISLEDGGESIIFHRIDRVVAFAESVVSIGRATQIVLFMN